MKEHTPELHVKKQPLLLQFAEYDDTILESASEPQLELAVLLCFLAAPTSIHLGF